MKHATINGRPEATQGDKTLASRAAKRLGAVKRELRTMPAGPARRKLEAEQLTLTRQLDQIFQR